MLAHSDPVINQQPSQGQAQQPGQANNGDMLNSVEMTSSEDSLMGSSEVDARKLVILGLPWDTTVSSLEQYFSQIGPLQEVVIMKDRSTGKSRGFGFVTFYRAGDAACAANQEHVVDGRRCEAKYALPRGGGPAPRTTRIFVARIPLNATDVQFRQYFEQFGQVQDAYMPKDASKQSHRGIGFVTFASADPVDHVMSTPHSMNGQELAIDRATPKDKASNMQLGNASSQRLRDIQQLATAAAAAACPAAAYASLHAMASAGFPADLAAAAPGLAAPGFLPLGLSGGMSYSAAVNNNFSARPAGNDGGDGEFSRYTSGGLVNGSGATPTYSSGGGSSGGNMGAVAGFDCGGSSTVNGGASGAGELFHPMESEGSQRRSSDEALPTGSHASEFTSNGLQDYRQMVPSRDHTAQALQGLTFSGNGDGIGIGLGMLQQQAAAAQAQSQAAFFKQAQMGQPGGSVMLDADAQARAQAILRSLCAPQGRNVLGGPGGLSEAHLAGLLAGNVDAAQLVNSIVNGAVMPGLPAAGQRPLNRLPGGRAQAGMGQFRSSAGTMGKGSVETRSGPRIFVGKLNKETTENDVKEYFTKFGFVMDVYLPRDKVNRSEHRGFGFVTFETEAAVLRIHAHGQHQIKGSIVAIDSAVPRREEGARTDDDMSTSSMVSLSRGLPSVPSIASMPSPSHLSAAYQQSAGPMAGSSGSGTTFVDPRELPSSAALKQVMDLNPAEDLSLGPARNHPQERVRHGYKPY